MTEPLYPVALLAGGLATRLRPLTEKIPKSLVEVAGEPFLAHQLRLLKRQGVERVVLCLGYLGEMVQEFAGNGARFGLELAYSFDGAVLRGTAGALRQAEALLADKFFVLYGDSYLPIDFFAVQRSFQLSGQPALMTVFRNEGAWDTSNVEYDGTRILAYDKRHRTPAMHYIDYGLGVFRRDALAVVPATGACDLADLYGQLLAAGQLAAYAVEQRFYEIGSPAGIQELTRHLQRSAP
jgi:MurNAc alpha-1-phosphate uridylyltransferase